VQYSLSLSPDSVVPFAVELVECDPDVSHLFVSDFYLRRLILTIENAVDFKTSLRIRVRYQVHNSGVRQQVV